MEREVLVYVDTEALGAPTLAGRLWTRARKGRETASFEYAPGWLDNPGRFSFEPGLTLDPGTFHSNKALFGAIGDSAPDRWGRVLMRRTERRRARAAGETPRTLTEIDFLLMVNDEARLGALRFAEREGGPFLASHDALSIPPLLQLPDLLSAADHVASESASDEDLRLLLAPGSSLGGARPKASVRDRDGTLSIAKFPHTGDELDTVRWEAVALTLASNAGIPVPAWRLEEIVGRPVLILKRFDRAAGGRVPFLSAMSMLNAADNETRSYMEIADALRLHGADVKMDLPQLWRRMVFNILISNTDDHLRNHGFRYEGPDGWRLSRAYDLNPVPADVGPRVLSTAIDLDDGTCSVELAMSVAGYFELSDDEAAEIAGEVAVATSTWRTVARQLGIGKQDIERMVSAFEHEDLAGGARE